MIEIDGHQLTPALLTRIAEGETVRLSDDARARMDSSSTSQCGTLGRKWLWLGASTPPADHGELIRSFVEGHCGGVGEPLSATMVRATMAARANVLAIGVSGCRAQVADTLIAMLNQDIVPIVPSQGSLGAAAPAPLAHIARVACGMGGDAWVAGTIQPAAQAMAQVPRLAPSEKEVLSLINGSTLTAALAALAVDQARTLLFTAEAAAALSFEVVRADAGFLSAKAMALRGHPGAIQVASRLRRALDNSQLVHAERHPDPFSIRCTPAVLGAAWDALAHVTGIVTRELNGACDNPLIIDGDILEVGHFHAAPVALAMDHLKIALTQVCSLSERRTFRLTHGQLSGLPSFLVPGTGLNSGLMLAQYTAASLTSECKGLSHPASVDTIPTVQHREDHVSMGPLAARGALHILDLLADVLAIELLCGAQGIEFHMAGQSVDGDEVREVRSLHPGKGTHATYEAVRARVARWTDDRILHPDLEALGEAVRDGIFTPLAEGS